MPRIFPALGERQRHYYKRFPATAWFEYHCWENANSSDAQLWYQVRFSDGFKGTVFADELTNTPKRFYCDPPPKTALTTRVAKPRVRRYHD